MPPEPQPREGGSCPSGGCGGIEEAGLQGRSWEWGLQSPPGRQPGRDSLVASVLRHELEVWLVVDRELSPALGEAVLEGSGGMRSPRGSMHGARGHLMGRGPPPRESLASGVQRGAALSQPWSAGCVGWAVSHRRGTWTPREGPEGWSPLGAKAKAAGRAADILKNAEGFRILSTWEPAAFGKRMA